MLTYWKYALRAKLAAAFPSAKLRTGLDGPFDKAQAMLFGTAPRPPISNVLVGQYALGNYYSALPLGFFEDIFLEKSFRTERRVARLSAQKSNGRMIGSDVNYGLSADVIVSDKAQHF